MSVAKQLAKLEAEHETATRRSNVARTVGERDEWKLRAHQLLRRIKYLTADEEDAEREELGLRPVCSDCGHDRWTFKRTDEGWSCQRHPKWHMTRPPNVYTPNRAGMSKRVRTYDAADMAAKMRETFTDRPVAVEEDFDFDWPEELQHVGDSLGVAYSSDKWKPKRRNGKRDLELYKHVAESRNRILCCPDIVHWDKRWDSGTSEKQVRCIGPTVSFADGVTMMPDSFAILGLFKEANVVLHVAGSEDKPAFGKNDDDGVVTLTVKHGMLAGGKIKLGRGVLRPFIFVYTPEDGVLFIILGDELDVEKDGIVG